LALLFEQQLQQLQQQLRSGGGGDVRL